jgi:peptide/nickel transport system permease protein
MFQYLLKRLALMIVTLFGITVITFLIARLAPGDPAVLKVQGAMGVGGGRTQQLNETIIEDNRRILGLDKPILLNFHPRGRTENVRRTLTELASNQEYVRERARSQMLALRSAAIAGMMEALDQATTASFRNQLLEVLPKIGVATPPANFASLGQRGQVEWWWNWWQENRTTFTLENARKVARACFADPTSDTFRRVVAVGGCAVPFVIPYTESRDRSTADRATSVLAAIVAKSWNNLGETDEEARRTNLFRWRQWWKYHQSEYVEYTGARRLIRTVTDTQYGVWFRKILTFNFDESYVHHRPVLQIIIERLPVSLQLSLISIFLSYIISVPLGVFSATHQFKLSDKAVTTILFILYSLPSFWVADMLILFTTGGSFLNLFPTQGLHSPEAANLPFWSWQYLKDWVWHLVLPITCLTYADFAFLSRQTRVAMLETVRQDFIRTAQAKGLSRRVVIFKHALRNSMIPILTLMASLLPELLGGSLIIETIFGIQGMGKLTIDSIVSRDYAVINAVAFFSAFLTLLGILLSDLSYALVDPRIRYE